MDYQTGKVFEGMIMELKEEQNEMKQWIILLAKHNGLIKEEKEEPQQQVEEEVEPEPQPQVKPMPKQTEENSQVERLTNELNFLKAELSKQRRFEELEEEVGKIPPPQEKRKLRFKVEGFSKKKKPKQSRRNNDEDEIDFEFAEGEDL